MSQYGYGQPSPDEPGADPYAQPSPYQSSADPYAQGPFYPPGAPTPYDQPTYADPRHQSDPYGPGAGDPYGLYGQDPYAQNYAQMQPYGTYGGYGDGYSLPEHPQSTTVLLLAVLGFPMTPLWFVAWYMGAQARREIAAGYPARWDGNLRIGYYIAKIGSLVAIIGGVLGFLAFVLLVARF